MFNRAVWNCGYSGVIDERVFKLVEVFLVPFYLLKRILWGLFFMMMIVVIECVHVYLAH